MNRWKGNVLPRPSGKHFYLLFWISTILVTAATLTAIYHYQVASALLANAERAHHGRTSEENLTSPVETLAPVVKQHSNVVHFTAEVLTPKPQALVDKLSDSITPRAILHTDHGDIVFELFPKDAPITVENFALMSNSGVFNNSCFYRYEKGFVLQGGLHCNKPPPFARKARNVVLEYSRPNIKFSVALARAGGDLNSGGSEFFINLRDNTNSLGTKKKGGYAVFAQVIDGFDTITDLKKLPTKIEGLTRYVSPQPTITWIEIVNYAAKEAGATKPKKVKRLGKQ